MEIRVPNLLRIKPGAIDKLGKYIANSGHKKIVVIFGKGMRSLFESKINQALKSFQVEVLLVLENDDQQLEKIVSDSTTLPGKTEAILAVGGGRPIDIGKVISHIYSLPLFVFATSLSTDAMCSPSASLVIGEKKRSLQVGVPYAVIIDTEIIKNAPAVLTLSGIGDLLSKYTAIYDWKLSYKKTGERVDDFAVLIAQTSAELLTSYSKCDCTDLEFLRIVAGSLTMGGLAMAVSKSSRPASGSEHLISHAYDKICKAPTYHGIQVGAFTLLMAKVQNNTFYSKIHKTMEESGLLEYLRAHPLNEADVMLAIDEAPMVKENFYTVLSDRENRELAKKMWRELFPTA